MDEATRRIEMYLDSGYESELDDRQAWVSLDTLDRQVWLNDQKKEVDESHE